MKENPLPKPERFHPVLDPLRAQLIDAAAGLTPAERVSFPLPAPGKAIDHVFVSPDLRVLATRVETAAAGASDHWPLVVDLTGPQLG